MEKDSLQKDYMRYANKKNEMPKFQKYYRKAQNANNVISRNFYKCLLKYFRSKNLIELAANCKIGDGLYIGHPYAITINPKAIIGSNCNIHKGVTIGQENRGKRKGTPVIGNDVWIGINSTIVGNITIGDDVLIAANTFVNKDIPSHSIVFGNPCVIKPCVDSKATESYINNRCNE